jgi:amino acid permease
MWAGSHSRAPLRTLLAVNALFVIAEAAAAFSLFFAMAFFGIFPSINVIIVTIGAAFTIAHMVWVTKIYRQPSYSNRQAARRLLISLIPGTLVILLVFARLS